MSQTTLDLNAESDSDDESVDSQATVVIEDNTFNPIRLIDCATLVESGRDILRRMGIFEYQGKGIAAFYQGSGTSGAPALKGTYLPFYGETNKLLKAIDINFTIKSQLETWKTPLKEITKLSRSVLNYFEDFYEVQISASIDSPFWNRLSSRDFILSHEWNKDTREFVPLPEPIPSSGHFSEIYCARRIVMETGEINDFLRGYGARIGEIQIDAYLLRRQRERQQQRQEAEEARRLADMSALHQAELEENNEEKRGRLKTEEGGRSLRKRKKSKKSKKTNKKRKTRKYK